MADVVWNGEAESVLAAWERSALEGMAELHGEDEEGRQAGETLVREWVDAARVRAEVLAIEEAGGDSAPLATVMPAHVAGALKQVQVRDKAEIARMIAQLPRQNPEDKGVRPDEEEGE